MRVSQHIQANPVGAPLELSRTDQGCDKPFRSAFLKRTGGIHEFQEGLCDLLVRPFSSHFEQGRFQPVQQRDELFQALIDAQVNVDKYPVQAWRKFESSLESPKSSLLLIRNLRQILLGLNRGNFDGAITPTKRIRQRHEQHTAGVEGAAPQNPAASPGQQRRNSAPPQRLDNRLPPWIQAPAGIAAAPPSGVTRQLLAVFRGRGKRMPGGVRVLEGANWPTNRRPWETPPVRCPSSLRWEPRRRQRCCTASLPKPPDAVHRWAPATRDTVR